MGHRISTPGFRHLFAGCLGLFFVVPALAQTTWVKAVFYSTPIVGDGQIAEAPGGGYLVAGRRQVFRLDPAGGMVWFLELNSGISSLALSADGGFVVAGQKLVGEPATPDLWVAKFDGAGTPVWQRTYGGADRARDGEFASSIHATADGGFVVGGSIEEPGPGSRSSISPWILRLDSNGDPVWDRKFRKGLGGCRAQPTSDGGLIALAGYGQGASGNPSPWLIKMDASGNVQWQNRYEGPSPGPSGAETIVETTGGLVVVASYFDEMGNDNGQIWVFQIDASGQFGPGGFARSIGDAFGYELVSDAAATADGGTILVGRKQLGSEEVLWIVRLDASGNVLSERTYDGYPIGVGTAVIRTSDGGFAILADGGNGFTILKTDGLGEVGTCLASVSSASADRLPQVSGLNVSSRPVSPVAVADPEGPYPQNVVSTLLCGG